jgi:PKD repeat protein
MELPLVRRWRRVSRGQALVEMAIIMPVLLLLLVMAIDFGRVFFGWVGLQNAARIGASYAAIHPDAWSAPDNPIKQLAREQYATQVFEDAKALNCDQDTNGDGTFDAADLPLPTFTSVVGTPSAFELGDHAAVTLNCQFSLITPLANGILGGGVQINAVAVFPVRGGTIANIPTPNPIVTPSPTPTAVPTATPRATPTPTPIVPTPTPTQAPCQAPIANFVGNPNQGPAPLRVTFTDTSIPQGCPITSWSWDFQDDGSVDSTVQNPTFTYGTRGNYKVRLTVTSAAGSNSLRVNAYIKVQ